VHTGRDTIQAGGNVTQTGGDYVGRDKVTYNYAINPPQSESERRNRQRMLQKVWQFWVVGVLENSLHYEDIRLGMYTDPESVRYPWQMMIEHLDRAPQQFGSLR
jgi:hypothetical protein